MTGEVETIATGEVLKISINVSNIHHDIIFRYGEHVFSNEILVIIQYTPIGEDAGHYESIVAKSPSHTDGGNRKVCLHRPLATKRHLIHVCRLLRHKGRAFNKIRQAANREELRMTSEAWYCFMCDDIVNEDLIKCQMCLSVSAGVGPRC